MNFSENCTELPQNLFSTEPALPVQHGTELTVKCKLGFINKGGNLVKCHDGEIVPVGDAPLCESKSMYLFACCFVKKSHCKG